MSEEIAKMFAELTETNITKKTHRGPYPALTLSRPELSQAGKVVLVPGGGTGVGFAISRAFVQAAADTVIIVGRRAEVLATAASRLEQEAKAASSKTKTMTRTVDVVSLLEVEAFWSDLAAKGITVDVLVANVAKFTEPKPILELGADETWSHFEVNVKSPMYFVEKFHAQPNKKQQVSLRVCLLFQIEQHC